MGWEEAHGVKARALYFPPEVGSMRGSSANIPAYYAARCWREVGEITRCASNHNSIG
jgi:hypothetical protein